MCCLCDTIKLVDCDWLKKSLINNRLCLECSPRQCRQSSETNKKSDIKKEEDSLHLQKMEICGRVIQTDSFCSLLQNVNIEEYCKEFTFGKR